MKSFGKWCVGLVLGLSTLAPDIAAAAPRATGPVPGDAGLVIRTGGVVCDLDGCRTYENRRRRIYVDPPIEDDNSGFYQEPPIYERRQRRNRIYIDPPAPVYQEPPVYRPRPIYRDAPVYAEPPDMLAPEHVQWCLDRYRSYNPRTNRYMVRRNVFRSCISPYS